MKFTGTLLNMDGHADSQGDIFTRMAKIDIPKEAIKVTHNFDQSKILGSGKITREGKKLTYEIELDTTILPAEVLKQLTPAVGGVVHRRRGNKIEEVRITQISLSGSSNADSRIKKLGEQS